MKDYKLKRKKTFYFKNIVYIYKMIIIGVKLHKSNSYFTIIFNFFYVSAEGCFTKNVAKNCFVKNRKMTPECLDARYMAENNVWDFQALKNFHV